MHKKFPLSVACSYSHADQSWMRDIQLALTPLVRTGVLKAIWSDRQILAGDDWNDKIRKEMGNADIILVLVSREFLASDYCMRELEQARQRRDSDDATVVPIILRECNWREVPFGNVRLGDVQVLPKDGKPVAGRKDARLAEVAQGIEKVAHSIIERSQPPDVTILEIEKVLTFHDAQAHRATADRKVLFKANREGLAEFWFRNLSCDGHIESKTIDGQPPDDEKTSCGVTQLCRRFSPPLHLGEQRQVNLSCGVLDAFKPTDDLAFINAIDDETGKLRAIIHFHPDRPCLAAEAFIAMVGQPLEPLPGLPKLSQDMRLAEIEITNPKLGFEYVIRWKW